jgi:hypothetical protein
MGGTRAPGLPGSWVVAVNYRLAWQAMMVAGRAADGCSVGAAPPSTEAVPDDRNLEFHLDQAQVLQVQGCERFSRRRKPRFQPLESPLTGWAVKRSDAAQERTGEPCRAHPSSAGARKHVLDSA